MFLCPACHRKSITSIQKLRAGSFGTFSAECPNCNTPIEIQEKAKGYASIALVTAFFGYSALADSVELPPLGNFVSSMLFLASCPAGLLYSPLQVASTNGEISSSQLTWGKSLVIGLGLMVVIMLFWWLFCTL
jgi:hypothetical protein